MHRWILVLLLAAIVVATAWTLTGQYKPEAAPDPWRAIPSSAAVIIEVSDPLNAWDRWTHTAQLWNGLRELEIAAAIDLVVGRIAERSEVDDALRHSLGSTTLLIAIVPLGADRTGTLWIWNTRDAPSMQRLVESLNGSDKTDGDGGTTLMAFPDIALGALHCTWSAGLAMMASDPDLLESALRSLAKGTPADSALTEARATLGAGTDAHVLVNGRRLPQLLGAWFNAETVDAPQLPEGWSALDARVRPEAMLFSGVLFTSADDHQLARLNDQGSGRFAPSRVLPREAGLSRTFHMIDPQRWIEDAGLASDTIADALLSWVNGPVTLAQAATDSGAIRTWAVMQGDDPSMIARSLARACPRPQGCDTLQYRGQRMVHTSVNGGFERALGPSFATLERPWYTLIADKAVFSDDPDALRAAIDAWLDGTSQADDMATADLIQRYGGTAAATIWCDIGASLPLLRTHSRTKDPAAFDPSTSPWSDLGGILLQCTPGPAGRAFLSISIEFAQQELSGENVSALWTATLPAPLVRKPDLLRNTASGSRDVLVQDRDHAIHVFSSTGQLRWSRALDGPILGEVHQVDRYRNGKLQVLFNTEGQVHLIDRNGKDVEGFPITLKEKATAPLAVFDYDDKRDYRILLPTAEGRVINIGIDGRLVDGWDAPVLPRTAQEVVRHLRIRGKDHLLIVDGAGGLHVCDRRGALRYTPKATLPGLHDVVEVRPALEIGATLILWTDTTGAVNRTSLDGATERMIIPLRAIEHAVAANLSTGPALIACSGDSLVVVDDRSELLLARSFDASISAPALLFDLGNEMVIGVVCGSTQELHLIALDGREMDGSPFKGSTPFSIADLNLDGQWEVIAGDRSGQLVAHSLQNEVSLP